MGARLHLPQFRNIESGTCASVKHWAVLDYHRRVESTSCGPRYF